MVARLDWPAPFFYLDSPYYGIKVYEVSFGREDFGRLAESLVGPKGRFLMCLNDDLEVRKIFKTFRVQPVSTKYSSMNGRARSRREILVRNY